MIRSRTHFYGTSSLNPLSFSFPFQDTIMELVRKEAEHCDHLGGFFILQSLAGGTGSGMGTRVSEALRDHFASSFVFNTVVWPYKSGEVIVQR